MGRGAAVQRLFVYGTLAPGRSNHEVVEDIPGSWEPASMKGVLFPEGWGATMGYPGVVPSTDGGEVEGFLFASADLDEHWPRLDSFEGDGYERVSVTVTVGDGQDVEAYVYALKRGS